MSRSEQLGDSKSHVVPRSAARECSAARENMTWENDHKTRVGATVRVCCPLAVPRSDARE